MLRLLFAGGVKNATHRYDLPPPPLAVRNLVRPPNFSEHAINPQSKFASYVMSPRALALTFIGI